MPFLDDLKKPLMKIILESPLHGLFSKDNALVSFTDHLTGTRLSFSVPYQRDHRIIRVICPKGDKYWKKFIYGSPLKITIQGSQYQGWAEIIDDPEEVQKEWCALIRNKSDLITQLGLSADEKGNNDLNFILAKTAGLDILRIEVSGKK
jgi:hypothetical protein